MKQKQNNDLSPGPSPQGEGRCVTQNLHQQREGGSARRSEEIVDIVDRMPMAFGRWVALSVLIFAALLLIFGWVIKYPDTVTGYIKIK